MKTNKQQTVILILLVIPTTILAIVTTNATSQQALPKVEAVGDKQMQESTMVIILYKGSQNERNITI